MYEYSDDLSRCCCNKDLVELLWMTMTHSTI